MVRCKPFFYTGKSNCLSIVYSVFPLVLFRILTFSSIGLSLCCIPLFEITSLWQGLSHYFICSNVLFPIFLRTPPLIPSSVAFFWILYCFSCIEKYRLNCNFIFSEIRFLPEIWLLLMEWLRQPAFLFPFAICSSVSCSRTW